MEHQISYADILSERRLEEYLQNGEEVAEASTPGQSVEELLLDVPAEDPDIPPSNLFPAQRRQKRARPEIKCQYVQVTSVQLEKLKQLFKGSGRSETAEWYHKETGIPLRNCQNLLTKLRKGLDLAPPKPRTGRPRILLPEHTAQILAFVRNKTEATLHKLVTVVTNYEAEKLHPAGVEGQFEEHEDDEDTGEGAAAAAARPAAMAAAAAADDVDANGSIDTDDLDTDVDDIVEKEGARDTEQGPAINDDESTEEEGEPRHERDEAGEPHKPP